MLSVSKLLVKLRTTGLKTYVGFLWIRKSDIMDDLTKDFYNNGTFYIKIPPWLAKKLKLAKKTHVTFKIDYDPYYDEEKFTLIKERTK